jgi:hypothetical protein
MVWLKPYRYTECFKSHDRLANVCSFFTDQALSNNFLLLRIKFTTKIEIEKKFIG